MEYINELITTITNTGYARFNFVDNKEGLVALADKFGERVHHPEAASDGIMAIQPLREKSQGLIGQAFTRDAISLHTDGPGVRAYKSYCGPANVLLLWAKDGQSYGGETLVADGKAIHHTLQTKHPKLLEYLCSENSGNFLTQPDHHYQGPIITLEPFHIRFKSADLEEEQRILYERFLTVAQEHMTIISLQQGEGVAIDNRRTLHGRRALSWQPRTLLHILAYSELI